MLDLVQCGLLSSVSAMYQISQGSNFNSNPLDGAFKTRRQMC